MKKLSSLSDLRYEDFVLYAAKDGDVEEVARKFFHELFDPFMTVYCRVIFEESEGGVIKSVYECYQDPGAIDRLYVVKFVNFFYDK